MIAKSDVTLSHRGNIDPAKAQAEHQCHSRLTTIVLRKHKWILLHRLASMEQWFNSLMATILLAWELGGGLGHFMNLRPLMEELPRRGHRVIAALRDLSSVHKVLSGAKVDFLQAPFQHPKMRIIEPTCTFAQILHNCGFAEVEELATLAGAWRLLFDCLKPDLIVFDHSPTALLAARGFPARQALVGEGFSSPPDESPLTNLRTAIKPDWVQLQAHEDQVLANINEVLRRRDQPAVDRVARLYNPVDESFLLTFPEIDCYPHRRGATYWGKWAVEMGQPPQWPVGNGPKIFGYLKPFPALPQLLGMLQGLPNPILIYASGVDDALKNQFRSPNLHFADGPINLVKAARECDLAILNGTHGSAAAMLLAGKPTLHIPIFLEQGVTAQAVAKLGAGINVMPNEPAKISAGLQALLHLEQFGNAARGFAAQYADFDSARQIAKMVDRVEQLAVG
jgi:hypothetical protein